MDVKFYLADEFRAELSGKATAIGLYPHNRIIAEINKEARAKLEEQFNGQKVANAFERIAFLFSLDVTPGPHEINFMCLLPDGRVFGETGPQSVVADEGQTLSHVISASPFYYDNEGNYIARLIVDGTAFDFPFTILIKYT